MQPGPRKTPGTVRPPGCERPVAVAILGPTASGKSAVAMGLAQRLGGEIISCDSMQVYRGMDIGTAKPSPRDRIAVPHHLIDVLDIGEAYNCNIFLLRSRAILGDGHWAGRIPILVGGTGMYARALVYGQALLPSDPGVYRQLLRESAEPGDLVRLTEELARASQATARRCAGNPRRIYRALEVLRLTGQVPETLSAQATGGPSVCDNDWAWLQVVLLPPAEQQREQIRLRTAGMFANGWLDEVRGLMRKGLPDSPTARQALGYRDIAEFLSHGSPATSMAELQTLVFQRTVQYARRQRTWFRNQHPQAHVVRGLLADPARFGTSLGEALTGVAGGSADDRAQVINSLCLEYS